MFRNAIVITAGLILSAQMLVAQVIASPVPSTSPVAQSAEPDKAVYFQAEDPAREEAIYLEIRGAEVTGFVAKGQQFELTGQADSTGVIQGTVKIKKDLVPFKVISEPSGHIVLQMYDQDIRMKKASRPTTQPITRPSSR